MQKFFANLQQNHPKTDIVIDGVMSKEETSFTRAPAVDLNQLPIPADLGKNVLAPQLNFHKK
jgi:hypothetical protein